MRKLPTARKNHAKGTGGKMGELILNSEQLMFPIARADRVNRADCSEGYHPHIKGCSGPTSAKPRKSKLLKDKTLSITL